MSKKTISGANPLDIIEQTLKRLYTLIDAPSATDATFFRVALKAVEALRYPQQEVEPGPAEEPVEEPVMEPVVEPVVEPTPDPVEPPTNLLEGLSVRVVQEMVDSGEMDPEIALEAEQNGAGRVTLIAWLEDYIEASAEGQLEGDDDEA